MLKILETQSLHQAAALSLIARFSNVFSKTRSELEILAENPGVRVIF